MAGDTGDVLRACFPAQPLLFLFMRSADRPTSGARQLLHDSLRALQSGRRLAKKTPFGSQEWLTTVIFEQAEGGVRLTHTILHQSREAQDGHLQAGIEAGSVQTLRRMDKHIAHMANLNEP